jgi:cytochrome c-type biogenesis protein CcmE
MNKKKKIFLSLTFIAGVFFTGIYGIDSSDSYFTVSELLSDSNAHIGQNVNVMGIVEYGSLEVAPEMTAFKLKDENNENLKVNVEYTGNLSSNLAEGKKVSISGTMISESMFKANKIVTGCPSKYTE